MGDIVWSVAISSDGQYVAAGGWDHTRRVSLFSRKSGTPLWNYSTGLGVKSVAVSSDGQYIASGSDDRRLYLFNRISGTPLWNSTQDGFVETVAISSDSQYVVAGSADSYISYFKRDNPTRLWRQFVYGLPLSVAISSNGQYIVAGSGGPTAYGIYLFDGDNQTVWSYPTSSKVETVAISHDGQYIVGGDHHAIYMFKRDSKIPIWICRVSDVVWSVAISENGQAVAAGAAGEVLFFSQAPSLKSVSLATTSTPGQSIRTLPDIRDLLSNPIVSGTIFAVLVGIILYVVRDRWKKRAEARGASKQPSSLSRASQPLQDLRSEPQNHTEIGPKKLPSPFTYDVFVCHASEDKREVAEPLTRLLMNKGLKVWYDEFTLKVGDSLRQKIDYGLAHSRYGIVILSQLFFKKNWPQRELDGLAAREDSEGHKVILPVWHRVDRDYVVKYSPTLAGRLASRSSDGLDIVLKELLDVIMEPLPPSGSPEIQDSVAKTAARIDIDNDMRLMFLEYVQRLTPSHLRVLEFLDNPHEYGERHSVTFGSYMAGGVSTILEEAIPELKGRRGFYDQLVRDLHARGLINIDQNGIHVMMNDSGMFASRTTEEGKKFLTFIAERGSRNVAG